MLNSLSNSRIAAVLSPFLVGPKFLWAKNSTTWPKTFFCKHHIPKNLIYDCLQTLNSFFVSFPEST